MSVSVDSKPLIDTLKSFRCNTYEKTGGGPVMANQASDERVCVVKPPRRRSLGPLGALDCGRLPPLFLRTSVSGGEERQLAYIEPTNVLPPALLTRTARDSPA